MHLHSSVCQCTCITLCTGVCIQCVYYTVLKEKNDEYSNKVKTRRSNDKTLFELARTVKELSELNEEGRLLHVESTVLSEDMPMTKWKITLSTG